MIQEPYQPWPAPGSVIEVDVDSPMDGTSADGLRHLHRLRQRGLFTRLRDWWRGHTCADLESYDAKIRKMDAGATVSLTDQELVANAFRRQRWKRG